MIFFWGEFIQETLPKAIKISAHRFCVKCIAIDILQ